MEIKEDITVGKEKLGIAVQKKLGVKERVLGLGERTYEMDRRRATFNLWNVDVGGRYTWYTDPMYKTINFMMTVNDDEILGFLFNSPSKGIADIGNLIYDKITVGFVDKKLEFLFFRAEKMESLLEALSSIVGKPFMLPEWALGYQISRYSYYPSSLILDVIKEHEKEGIQISALYLDIDYMEGYKMFTWDRDRFPNPKEFIKELHGMGVKVITIFSPCLKLDQKYRPFKEAMGLFVENENGEIYVDDMWPGKCAWIDFFSTEARDWWSRKTEEWVKEYDVDGIWTDMNEPAVLGKGTFVSAYHDKTPHTLLHNAYGLLEAEATFRGMKNAGKEPYILSRSAYNGIQKYAVVWTGDNVSSWEDLRLQLSLALSLSISGVPYVGFDIGGFSGREEGVRGGRDYELLLRYFQAGLFMPLFRNHKSKGGEDQEIYLLPEPWRRRIKEVIGLRYDFIPYLYELVREAHEYGHPLLRPLPYYFPHDNNTYVCDEFMVGKDLLMAPVLEKCTNKRRVYLPEGKWAYLNTGEIFEGNDFVSSPDDLPIFVRYGSKIELRERTITFNENGFKIELKNQYRK
ncbi:TIM-barrel domain-containing protein [Sulfuracidifex tepidarius]|uniref:TIM-barrel domain-containing protein n=1 Tax=Sulfuracidifex tepidarius TaxID=1294262 RepID=UPI000A043272|nr:TIM-barrel domain-containing protein [Sulfuracidifex tepidarius]